MDKQAITITLPCKLGDALYREDGMWECIGFECDQNGLWRVKLRKPNPNGSDNFFKYFYCRETFDSFDKTIFASKEECEKIFPTKTIDPEIEALVERQRFRSQYFLNQRLARECFD